MLEGSQLYEELSYLGRTAGRLVWCLIFNDLNFVYLILQNVQNFEWQLPRLHPFLVVLVVEMFFICVVENAPTRKTSCPGTINVPSVTSQYPANVAVPPPNYSRPPPNYVAVQV